MSLPRKHARAGRATVTRIDATTQACRPMADYLFAEALGAPPSNDLLRSAKDALLPLRGHPGRIGRAVIVLLKGGELQTDYDDAVSVLLHAARGAKVGASGRSGEWAYERESAAVISLLPRPSGVQLTFHGLDD
jgi:hypothetical protein